MEMHMHYGSDTSYNTALSIAKRRSEAAQRKKAIEEEIKQIEVADLKHKARLGITADPTHEVTNDKA